MTRSTRLSVCALVLVALLSVALLSGCSAQPTKPAAPAAGEATATAPAAIPVKIGTLATEDSLPLWVAENMGYFSHRRHPEGRDHRVPVRPGA